MHDMKLSGTYHLFTAAVLTALTLISTTASAQTVLSGIDVLEANGFEQLQGKRIGLVTNPTGVDRYLNSTIDVLHSAPGVELVALFGPEHGVRGNAHAGEHVEGQAVDPRTGVPIFSLYGKTRLPSARLPLLHLHQHHGQCDEGRCLRGRGDDHSRPS